MSWKATLDTDATKALHALDALDLPETVDEREQFRLAKEAAKTLVSSGSLGPNNGEYRVELSGKRTAKTAEVSINVKLR